MSPANGSPFIHGPTLALAEFSSRLSFESLPATVVKQASTSLLNFLACAVAGSQEPTVVRSTGALRPYQGRGDATVIVHPVGSDPITAAFLNCLASTILAFDETHARSLVHPVGPVAAAALAMGEERRLDGKRLITALVAGVELVSRASLAVSAEPAAGHVGWSQSAICGTIGAAAAVASLLELQPSATADAIALGANASAGLRALNGTPAVSHAVANAASSGFRAALFAQSGLAASHTALEHSYGFCALFSERPHLGYLTQTLHESWAVEELNFKPYPCGVVAHAAIDAAREVRSVQERIGHDSIEQVTAVLHPSCLALGDRPVVATGSEASVSIQYWIATGLLRADVGPDCLSATWIDDPARQALQRRVRLDTDSSLGRDAVQLTVRLRSGKELRSDVSHCRGSQERPMTREDVEAKFLSATSKRLSPDIAQQVISQCRQLADVSDVGDILRLLRTAR